MYLNLPADILPVNKNNILECPPVEKILSLFQTEFSYFQLALLNQMVSLCSRYRIVYISQERLAQYLGCTRETVNRLLAKISELGLLRVINRGVKRTCLYQLPTMLFDFYVRKKLSKVIKSFDILPYFWLFSKQVMDQSFIENVTQVNYKNYIINLSSPISISNNIYNVSNHLNLEINRTINVVSSKKEVRKMSNKKVELLSELKNLLMLDDFNMTTIEDFEFDVLLEAKKRLTKIIAVRSVRDKASYFVCICKQLVEDAGKVKKPKLAYASQYESREDSSKGEGSSSAKPFSGHQGQSEEQVAASWRRPDILDVYARRVENLKTAAPHVREQMLKMFQENYLKYNSPEVKEESSPVDGKEMTLLERRNARHAEYKANGYKHNRYIPS